MPREKAQAAPTARLKVPMRRRGADCLVVATKRGNARGAKGAGHRRWAWANWVKPGRALMFSGRRQPSCGDTSRMNREVQVRMCVQERLACSAGDKPAGAKVRRPVVRIAGWRETKTLKPIDEVSLRSDSRVAGNQDSEAYRRGLSSGRLRVTGP